MLPFVALSSFAAEGELPILVNDDDDEVITAPKSVDNYNYRQIEKTQTETLKKVLDESDLRSVTSFQTQAGISNIYGEFLRLRMNIGRRGRDQVSFVMYGGIGHDWIFKAENQDYIKDPYTGKTKKTLEWHAGLGINVVPVKHNTLSVLLDYSQTSYVHKTPCCLTDQLEWSYFFLKNKLGVFASAGVSLYFYDDDFVENKTHSRAKFAFSAGVTYRFF